MRRSACAGGVACLDVVRLVDIEFRRDESELLRRLEATVSRREDVPVDRRLALPWLTARLVFLETLGRLDDCATRVDRAESLLTLRLLSDRLLSRRAFSELTRRCVLTSRFAVRTDVALVFRELPERPWRALSRSLNRRSIRPLLATRVRLPFSRYADLSRLFDG